MENYRPISILPFLSKVVEKLIVIRLNKYLEKYNILTNAQFGFRKGYSTSTAIFTSVDAVRKYMDNGFLVAGIVIDFAKAFDSLNHVILKAKLERYGINGTPLSLIENYLKDRQQIVHIGKFQSEIKSINLGVPQGSILGPILFLLYINDLPLQLVHASPVLYADDTNLLIADRNERALITKVNEELKHLYLWCSSNAIQLNPQKTVYMLFHSEAKRVEELSPVIYNSSLIARTNNTKFLGIVIDNHLKFTDHIRLIMKKASYGLHVLARSRHFFTSDILVNLYYAFVHCHINYGIVVWGCTYKTHLLPIFRLQKRALRVVLRCTSNEIVNMFEFFDVLNVYNLVTYNIAQLMFQILHDKLNINTVCLQPSHRTTDAIPQRLLLPKIRTNYGKNTLEFTGAACWNSLNAETQILTSFGLFKKSVKQHLMSENCM